MKQEKAAPADSHILRQRLEALRKALLALHKSLVDSERVSYEKNFGAIQTPNQFLQLLISDPWFAWLQPLSLLIVSMDEALDERKPLTSGNVDALSRQCARLLVPQETSEGFPGHYYEAMQRDPDVVLAHAAVVGLTRKSKTRQPKKE